MLRRWMACLVLFVVPTLAWAQTGPDRLLPAETQIYFRWDGFDAHRPAFEKTAVGQMMKGETGKFFDALWDWINDAADLAGQADAQAPAMIKDALKIVAGVGHNGVAVSVAVKQVNPPQGQVTLVFPKAAGKDGVLLPFVRKVADLAQAGVQETKIGKRTVQHINVQLINLGWWNEGDDAIFVIGTEDPGNYAKLIDNNETGLAQSALYKQVSAFKEFTTASRGFVDATALAKMGSDFSPEVSRLLEDLGAKGIKSITFVSGFDGPAERAVAEIDIPGPRKGVLALIGKKKIALASLPPLPDDLTSFSASNFNAGSVYDAGVQVAEGVARMFDPNIADNIKEFIRQAEGIVNVKIGDDLFGSFDDMTVTYSSPSEGPLGLGSVVLLKLKNEQKLRESVDALIKAIPQIPGVNVKVKKRNYHGGEISELQVNNITVRCFAVHKGWLAAAAYPQPIYGFILRSQGDLPAWKADAKLTTSLAKFPAEFAGISVS